MASSEYYIQLNSYNYILYSVLYSVYDIAILHILPTIASEDLRKTPTNLMKPTIEMRI